jgi:hypothetical protein
MPFPANMPAFRSAFLSTDGEVMWLEPYHLWDGKRRVLIGYDSLGVGVGKLSLAETDRLLEIRRGSAIVLSVDSLGVETIRVNRFAFR